jgi:hypothetical protein
MLKQRRLQARWNNNLGITIMQFGSEGLWERSQSLIHKICKLPQFVASERMAAIDSLTRVASVRFPPEVSNASYDLFWIYKCS